MTDDLRPPFRQRFDSASDPYTARNALGITGTGGGPSGPSAPPDAQYIVAATDPVLTNERVLTNTATITWDFTVPGQAKASTAAGGGNVSNSGTPTLGQYAKWVTATTIQGVSAATVLGDIGAQPAGNYQPLDADLTSLAAASATNAIYYRSAANTWATVTIGTGLSFTTGTLAATSAGGNVSNSGTPTAGQWPEWVTATTIKGIDPPAPACGRLQYVSATQLKFVPFNGDRIKINGVLYAIPSGGIAGLTNTGLSANTTYYVYAFNNAGTITGEFSTTGHTTSTTAGNVGTEIKSGDDTRTLIGIVRAAGGPPGQFFDTEAGARLVRSWFNRVRQVVSTAISAATTSTTAVAIGGSDQFVCFAGEAVQCFTSGYFTTGGAGQTATMQVFMDGALASTSSTANTITQSAWPYTVSAIACTQGLAEGYHTANAAMSVPTAVSVTYNGALAVTVG